MLVDSHAQHHLGTVLVDDELVQVLSQRLWGDMTVTDIARAAQRASCGLVRLVEGRKALAAEVGAVIRRLCRAPSGEGAPANGIEGEVGRPGVWGGSSKEGASDYHGE